MFSFKTNFKDFLKLVVQRQWSKHVLTQARRQVFSRNAPTQPVKPIMNVIVPAIMLQCSRFFFTLHILP